MLAPYNAYSAVEVSRTPAQASTIATVAGAGVGAAIGYGVLGRRRKLAIVGLLGGALVGVVVARLFTAEG